jgi:predicted secreted protein
MASRKADFLGKYDTPEAPDYASLANQQGKAEVNLLNAQTQANRPNIYTPLGSQTWSQTPVVDRAAYDKAMAAYTSAKSDPGAAYLAANPDVAQAGMDPLEHYQKHGKGEGRQGFWYAPTEADFTSPGSGWEQRINLTPEAQSALEAEQRITAGRNSAAESLLPQVRGAFDTPVNYGGLPARSGGVSAGQYQTALGDVGEFQRDVGDSGQQEWRQRGQSAIEQLMAPQLAERRAAQENSLVNQGFTRGSEAWNSASREIGDAETRAGLQAIAAGRDESNSLFSQDLQRGQFRNQATASALGEELMRGNFYNSGVGSLLEDQISAGAFNNTNRTGALAEELQRRSGPLNELNALMAGTQVQQPNFNVGTPTGRAATPDLVGAGQSQYDAALDAFSAKNAQRNSDTQAMSSLAALYTFSDKRLKRDIEWLGFTLPSGIRIYKYRMLGSPSFEIGVLAQEVEQIMPEAVKLGPTGFLMVNYDKVLA